MKELKGMKIELPEGYELKQEGETYKVVKKEVKYAEKLEDIDRPYRIHVNGCYLTAGYQPPPNVYQLESLEKAFLH